jgi:hypothetical protein
MTLFFFAVRRHHAHANWSMGMTTDLMAELARLAGLQQALAEFPDDVAAAFAQAMGNRDIVHAPTDPAAEPWPPMRAGVGL